MYKDFLKFFRLLILLSYITTQTRAQNSSPSELEYDYVTEITYEDEKESQLESQGEKSKIFNSQKSHSNGFKIIAGDNELNEIPVNRFDRENDISESEGYLVNPGKNIFRDKKEIGKNESKPEEEIPEEPKIEDMTANKTVENGTEQIETTTYPRLIPFKETHSPPIEEVPLGDFIIPRSFEEAEQEGRKRLADPLEQFTLEEIYEGCDDWKGCLGHTKSCILLKSCDTVTAYYASESGTGVVFEIMGRSSKYVAIGLSRDRFMGEDNVVECVRDGEDMRVFRSFNLPTNNRMNMRLEDHSAVTNTLGLYVDGWIYCSFMIELNTSVHNSTFTFVFDLSNEEFYLLIASGNMLKDPGGEIDNTYAEGIGYHDNTFLASEKRIDFLENIGKTTLQRILDKVHGVLLLISWILLLPISTFLARYFKDSFVDKYICGFSVWFGIHVSLNGVILGLTLLSFILVIISAEGKIGVKGWNFHNISGILFVLLNIIQSCLGVFIYKTRNPKYLIFFKIHAVLGHLIFFLAFAIIYLSKEISRGLPCDSGPILITWIVLYFLIHLIISYQICYVDYVQGSDISRIYHFGGLSPARVTNLEPEAPGTFVKKILLGVLIFVGFLAVISIIGLYASNYEDCFTIVNNKDKPVLLLSNH